MQKNNKNRGGDSMSDKPVKKRGWTKLYKGLGKFVVVLMLVANVIDYIDDHN